jgi:predicted transcriptional regulator
MQAKSLFIDFFGDGPNIRVLDYILTERELDFSKNDIVRNAGVGRSTLYRLWKNLIKNKIITPTRVIGKAKLFKLNTKNTQIKKLAEINDILTLEELKKKSESGRQKVVA